MAEEATPSRLRLDLDSNGNQVVILGTERISLSENAVDGFVHGLMTGKDDAKEYKAALNKIKAIRKPYNSVGKPIDSGNLKTIAEGEPVGKGVIDDE